MKLLLQKKSLIASLIIIFLLSACTRLLFLDRAPIGVLPDELKHIMTEKSLFLTGASVYKDWNPFSLTSESHDVKDSELLPVIMSPFVGVLPYTMYFVRLPFAILGVLDVFLIVLISYYLLGSKPAKFVGLLAAINPYLIFFSRLAFDTQVAMFFMLLGIVLLFALKKWWRVLSFISFAGAFYSYTGMKLIFFPFVLFSSFWFSFVYQKKEKLPYITVAFLALALVALFAFTLKSNPTVARSTEILTPFSLSIGKDVVLERTHAIISPLTFLVENKISVWFFHAVGSYVDAFSFRTLFVTGENSTHLALWYVGYFYLIDIVFIFLGMVFMLRENKKAFWFLLGVVLLAPITGAIRIEELGSHVMHAVMMFPALVIFGGYGLFVTANMFIKKRKLSLVLIGIIYFVSFANFLYTYFYRLPIYNSEGFMFSNRLLSRYLTLESAQSRIIVFSEKPDELAKEYTLYAKLYNNKYEAEKINASLIAQASTHAVVIGNVIFASDAKTVTINPTDTLIVKSLTKIPIPEMAGNGAINTMNIPILADGGDVFKIYNGKTCNRQLLKQYPYAISFKDLTVEKLPIDRFCWTFITAH